ncbi:hypothetical protein GCM10023189_23390 [Nibrella saemangeumensis]|uniref:Uncharacterized protein n=1 Tax=Nibrella saemangeumensis TaxID=1084526 RepID=A0ABP8MV72_9BACT
MLPLSRPKVRAGAAGVVHPYPRLSRQLILQAIPPLLQRNLLNQLSRLPKTVTRKMANEIGPGSAFAGMPAQPIPRPQLRRKASLAARKKVRALCRVRPGHVRSGQEKPGHVKLVPGTLGVGKADHGMWGPEKLDHGIRTGGICNHGRARHAKTNKCGRRKLAGPTGPGLTWPGPKVDLNAGSVRVRLRKRLH